MSDYLEPVTIPLDGSRAQYDDLELAFDVIAKIRGSVPDALRDFCETVWRGEIPSDIPRMINEYAEDSLLGVAISAPLQKRGYYARITQSFARYCAAINLGVVLDPFAGAGYLAKAFRAEGIPTIATDDYSWGFDGAAEKLDALEALRKYGNVADTVVLAWVPWESTADLEVWELARKEFPHLNFLVISEGPGGCTGSEAFGEIFSYWEELTPYETTIGLRDRAFFFDPRSELDTE